MTTKQIMEKYHIDESHSIWEPVVDNWFSVEAVRVQTGRLPQEGDDTKQILMDFLDNKELQTKLLSERGLEFGSMYLSAKRMLFRLLSPHPKPEEVGVKGK